MRIARRPCQRSCAELLAHLDVAYISVERGDDGGVRGPLDSMLHAAEAREVLPKGFSGLLDQDVEVPDRAGSGVTSLEDTHELLAQVVPRPDGVWW